MSCEIKVGDRVRVTKSEYTMAAPVGTVGRVVSIRPQEPEARYTVDREDGAGVGWAEEVEALPLNGGAP